MVIRPPNQTELRNLQSLLSTGEPYEILGCELNSTKKEIQKKFRDLARKYHPDKTSNNDGGDMMTKINNAYAVLSDERLREIYDVYMYDSFKYGDMEDGTEIHVSNAQETVLTALSLFFSVASWPFSKIAIIVQSSEKNVGTFSTVKRVYRKNGITGFFRGSGFLLATGVLEMIKDFAYNKIVASEKFSPRIQRLLDFTVRPILKYPYRLIMDLLDIELTLGVGDIIYRVILKQQDSGIISRNNPLQFKNFFYGAVYVTSIMAAKRGIRHLLDKFDEYCYNGYIQNPNNLFFRYSNFVMKNTFLHNAIVTLCVSPFEVVRSQYARLLLDSYNSGELVVRSINPILLALNIYKSNGIKKFFSGFIPFYFANLMESFSNECDYVYVDENDEDLY